MAVLDGGAARTDGSAVAPRPVAVAGRRRPSWLRRPRRPTDAARTFALTILVLTVLVGFLSPIVRSALVSLKTTDQLSELDSPLLPSVPRTFTYQGETLVGEATRVANDDRRGVASAYGGRGTFARCEYQMSSAQMGAGTCTFSNGAQYQVHIGG